MSSHATIIDGLFHRSTDPLLRTDADGIIHAVNAVGAALLEVDPAEIVGRSIGELFDSPMPMFASDHLEGPISSRTKQGGKSIELTPLCDRDDAGAIVHVCWLLSSSELLVDPVSRRLTLLVEASRLFAEANLDPDEAFETIGRLVSRTIGDTCVIRLLSADGAWLDAVSVHHVDKEKERMLRRLNAAFSQPADSGPAGRAVASGEPVLMATVDAESFRATLKAEYLEFFNEVGIDSVLMVPLRVRGRIIGTLGVTRDRGGASYTLDDQLLLQDLADRAAMAVETARLYAKVRRELAERESAESRYRRLIENIPTVTWTIDVRGSFTFISPNVEALLGYAPEEILADGYKFWERLVPQEDLGRIIAAYVTLFQTGEGFQVEFRTRQRDGRSLWLMGASWRVYEQNGELYADGTLSDISESKFARDSLQQAHDRLVDRVKEKTEVVGQLMERVESARQAQERFIASASHDLRTPLTIVRAELELLRHRPGHDEMTREALDRIDAQSRRLDHLASDLLLLATLDALGSDALLRPVRLDELVLEAIDALDGRASCRVFWNVDLQESVEVIGVAPLLKRALVNVLDNAATFSPEMDVVRVSLRAAGGGGEIEIADNGSGIAAEDLPRVFDPFYRADRARTTPGNGLGLTVARAIVDRHRGDISIASAIGHGTLVQIRFPGFPAKNEDR